MIENLRTYSSFIGILYLAGAVWYEYLYFESFGVDVFTYMSFGDILNLFLSKIPFLTFITIIIISIILLLNFFLDSSIKKISIESSHSVNERNRRNTLKFLYSLIILGTSLILFGISIFNNRVVKSEWYFPIKIFGFLLAFYWFIILFQTENKSFNTNTYIYLFIFVFFSSIYFDVANRIWKMRFVRNENLKMQIHFTNDSLLITNDSLVYLGKTNENIFIYNANRSKPFTSIIRYSDVKDLKIDYKVKWFKKP